MFEQQRYVQSSFSLFFPEQRDIHSRQRAIYERIRANYLTAHALAPDDSDAGAPRLVYGSHHGHSQIVIAGASVTLNVLYSPDWQTRLEDARSYVTERSALLFEVIECFDQVDVLYCGSVTRAHLPSDAADEDICSFVARRFTQSSSSNQYHDVLVKVTTIIDDLFFDNRMVQNYRTWSISPLQLGTVRLARRQAAERGVEIVDDYNSRFAYNEDKDFVVTRGSAADVISRNLAAVNEAVRQVQEGN